MCLGPPLVPLDDIVCTGPQLAPFDDFIPSLSPDDLPPLAQPAALRAIVNDSTTIRPKRPWYKHLVIGILDRFADVPAYSTTGIDPAFILTGPAGPPAPGRRQVVHALSRDLHTLSHEDRSLLDWLVNHDIPSDDYCYAALDAQPQPPVVR